MKSSLTDQTNINLWKGTTDRSGFDTLISNIETNEVQFIPLNTRFEKAVNTEFFNRIVSNYSDQYEHGDEGSYSSFPYPDSEIVKYEETEITPHHEIDYDGQIGMEYTTDENVQVYMDGTPSIEGIQKIEIKNMEMHDHFEYGIRIERSVCLIPALLHKVEMSTHTNPKKMKDSKDKSSISGVTETRYDYTLAPTLQGRTEMYPRRSRQHQNSGHISSRNFNTKAHGMFSGKNEQVSELNCENDVSQKLFTRIEKSSERIVRSIAVRNIDSIKRLGDMNPKLIVRVFEKYLSEILNCNAKILLGRKNLGLISRNDYLLEDSPQFHDSNMTYYLSVDNPFSCLLYPSIVQDSRINNKKMSIYSEYDNRTRTEQQRLKCNCSQRENKIQLVEEEDKLHSMKDNVKCSNYNVFMDNAKSDALPDMTITSGCACSQPISVQKSIEQSLEPKKISTIFSSLMNGNKMKMKKKCDCRKRNDTMQSSGTEELKILPCSCAKKAKKRMKSSSRSKSKSVDSKSKSNTKKCDCTEPCEPTTPITSEGNQLKEDDCECVPDLKVPEEKFNNSSSPKKELPIAVKPPCSCPCKELMKNGKPLQALSISKPPCDNGQYFDRLSSGTNLNLSLSTIESSELDRIAGILRDTKQKILGHQNGENNPVSNIKCFRNSSGIICQSEVIECSPTKEKGQTNTIEIRIKYPKKHGNLMGKCCASTCTNTEPTKIDIEFNSNDTDNDANYCTLFSKLHKEISSCSAKPTMSDLSMLLDSITRKDPLICQTTQCIRSESNLNVNPTEQDLCGCKTKNSTFKSGLRDETNRRQINGVFTSRKNATSCQTSSCGPNITKEGVTCLFRRDPNLFSTEEVESRRRSSDSLEDWVFEDDKEDIQIGSCSKNSCKRLVDRPAPVGNKTNTLLECDMKGKCIRQKLFAKFSSNIEPPSAMPPPNIPKQQNTKNSLYDAGTNGQVKNSQKLKPISGKNTPATKNSKKTIPLSNKNASSKGNIGSKPISKNNETPRVKSLNNDGSLANEPDKIKLNNAHGHQNEIRTDIHNIAFDHIIEDTFRYNQYSDEERYGELPGGMINSDMSKRTCPYKTSNLLYYLQLDHKFCIRNSSCRSSRVQCAGATCPCYNKHFKCCLPAIINKPRNYCIIPVKKYPPKSFIQNKLHLKRKNKIKKKLKDGPKDSGYDPEEEVDEEIVQIGKRIQNLESGLPRFERQTEIQQIYFSMGETYTQTSTPILKLLKEKKDTMVDAPFPLASPCLKVLLRDTFDAICLTADAESHRKQKANDYNTKEPCRCMDTYKQREILPEDNYFRHDNEQCDLEKTDRLQCECVTKRCFCGYRKYGGEVPQMNKRNFPCHCEFFI